MFVLGIDPGLSRCGYGLVSGGPGERSEARAAGLLSTPVDLGLPDRLAMLWADLTELVSELRPEVVVVERVFFQTNVRTAMSVGQASGLALAVASTAGIPVAQYTSNEVKMAVTGDGSASKLQVAKMVATLAGMGEILRPADVTDALALAVCHLQCAGLQARVAVAGTGALR